MAFTLKIRYFPPAIVVITAVCLLFCIVLSLLTAPDDVSKHLPALSETGIYPPTKYIFTACLVLPSVCLLIASFLQYFTMKEKLLSIEHQRHTTVYCGGYFRMSWLSVASCIFSFIAGICLLGLAIVPIKKGEILNILKSNTTLSSNFDDLWSYENRASVVALPHLMDVSLISLPSSISQNVDSSASAADMNIDAITVVHLIFTFLFMTTAFIHMILSTTLHVMYDKKIAANKRKLHPWIIVKICCIVTFLLMWPTSSIIIGMFISIFCDMPQILAGKCGLYQIVELFLGALIQYGIVSSILVFMLTYLHDLKDTTLSIGVNTPSSDINARLNGLSLERDFELDDDLEDGHHESHDDGDVEATLKMQDDEDK
nr:unnamed protein product [Naegleria fowleri]